jgi:galactose mutarotase-like enzyme
MNKYIGHESQILGVEEHRLVGGKGDGMRLLEVRNGKGLEFTVSLDRCADISRLSVDSRNIGFFAPCGYVSPKYYDGQGIGFLKSFTAGFLTTCGLTAVGSPCEDNGEILPLHGAISNTPSENHSYSITDDEIQIKAAIRHASLFGEQLILSRKYICSLQENTLKIIDTVKNIGCRTSPFMMLYHFNIGYPMLSEKSKVLIPSNSVTPRNEHAAKSIDNCLKMEHPQSDFEEQCYYYDVKDTQGKASVEIYNPDIEKRLIMRYGKNELNCFTQWKMMGEYEYVLGLEPGNCTPDGRDVMRKNGMLKFIEPQQVYTHNIELVFKDGEK